MPTDATLYMSMALNIILGSLLWRLCRPIDRIDADWVELIAQNARLIEENDDLHRQLAEADDPYATYVDDSPDESLDPEPWEFEDEGERWTR